MATPATKSGGRHRRRTHRRKETFSVGAVPGDYTVDPDALKPEFGTAFIFGPEDCREAQVADASSLHRLRREDMEGGDSLWLDIQGLGSSELMAAVAGEFKVHPLAMEDIVQTNQRAKADVYEDCVVVVIRMPAVKPPFHTEQLTLLLGRRWLVTFQEEKGDQFDPVRERLRKNLGRVRRKDTGYLAYALIDAVIDGYFPLLEHVGDRIDDLEDVVMSGNADRATAAKIHGLRREVVSMRRAVWPLREALRAFSGDHDFLDENTRLFLRDAQDHALRILDMVEGYRETLGSLMDMYLSSVSNKMNEVMQVLTVIATIFIPLTFVAGVYGMNFDPEVSPLNMPETKWYWGYPFAMGIMALMAAALLVYFRKRGWLGGKKG